MLAFLTTIRDTITRWWSEFTVQTKLMAGATLFVSLLMSGLTFWAVNTIQQDARLSDTRFGSDLGLLLAANVAPLVSEGKLTELAHFSQRFYDSTSSVRYILYADEEGTIRLSIPFSALGEKFDAPESGTSPSPELPSPQPVRAIQRRIQLPENYTTHVESRNFSALPLVRQHKTPGGEVTDVFVPLVQADQYLGVLAIGINPNPTVVASSHLTRDVTIAVFVSIWVMVILGAVFNALTITKPIKELLVGVKNIAAGNFKQRVDLPLGGELGELILSFNEMAERLEHYEEQNIEELTAEKAKLEILVSTIADGAVLLNNELQIILVNPTARRLFGWEGKDVVGEKVLYHLPVSAQVELTRPLYQMVQGECETAEFRITLDEPARRTIRLLLTNVLDQARENVKGIAMTIQDITREVELNEAQSQFISNVSHELRTPLFNIKSFIETLHEFGDSLGEEERREFLETANHETDRLTRLVNDVLDLSRLESSRQYHFEAVDLNMAIEQTLRSHQLNAKDKGIELTYEASPDLPTVLGHYDLLLQVFANLVGNALKFTPRGGKVVIRAYQLSPEESGIAVQQYHELTRHTPQSGSLPPEASDLASPTFPHTSLAAPPGFVRIEVADTGIGIDAKDLHTIFDRFVRVENRVHTLEGTGLGLSIVRNIVEKHHSTVQVVSEVGVGTTFWFDLAVFQEQTPANSGGLEEPQGRLTVATETIEAVPVENHVAS
uniref:two-component system sensor histidine kinase NblS n=1 Tax=Trichothermofontia sichuanensis TaxID=3045816 RepID=UPI00249F40AF|nr:ATP-binding protein [Trichothermofontia sichuanensis]